MMDEICNCKQCSGFVQWHETDKQRECIQVQPALLQNKKGENGFDLELMNLHRRSLVCLSPSARHPAAACEEATLAPDEHLVTAV